MGLREGWGSCGRTKRGGGGEERGEGWREIVWEDEEGRGGRGGRARGPRVVGAVKREGAGGGCGRTKRGGEGEDKVGERQVDSFYSLSLMTLSPIIVGCKLALSSLSIVSSF